MRFHKFPGAYTLWWEHNLTNFKNRSILKSFVKLIASLFQFYD